MNSNPSIGRITAHRRRSDWLSLRLGNRAGKLLRTLDHRWSLGWLPGLGLVLVSSRGSDGEWLQMDMEGWIPDDGEECPHLIEFQGDPVRALDLPRGATVDLWCTSLCTMDGRYVVVLGYPCLPEPRQRRGLLRDLLGIQGRR